MDRLLLSWPPSACILVSIEGLALFCPIPLEMVGFCCAWDRTHSELDGSALFVRMDRVCACFTHLGMGWGTDGFDPPLPYPRRFFTFSFGWWCACVPGVWIDGPGWYWIDSPSISIDPGSPGGWVSSLFHRSEEKGAGDGVERGLPFLPTRVRNPTLLLFFPVHPEHPKEGKGDGWRRRHPLPLSLVPTSPWGTTRVVPSVHGGMKGRDRRGPSQGLIRPFATSLPRASNPTAKLRAPHSGLKPSPFAKREAAVHLGRPGALPWSRGV